MAKKDKKSFSIKSIITMVLSILVMIAVLYFTPYLLADANSTGWYETGRYAHANLYPGLAIDSYTKALRRFPDPNAFPQGSSIKEAKNLLFSLKQGLSGIPFRSIYDLLVKKDFNGLRKLLASGALSMQKLEVARLDAAGRARVAADLKKVKAYINRILLFQDDQNRPRYSGTYTFLTLEGLKKKFRKQYADLKDIFVKSDIFIKADFPRLDAVFSKDLKILDTLSVANLPAVKTALRSRLKSLSINIRKLLKRNHIDYFKQVNVRIEGLKNSTEGLKNMLMKELYNKIWNKEFDKIRLAGGADKVTDTMLKPMYDKFKVVYAKVVKRISVIARDSAALEAHLKSGGRRGIPIPQTAIYKNILNSAAFKIPGYDMFKRQAGIYSEKMAQIKTRMDKLKKERDDAQMKSITAKGPQRVAVKAKAKVLRKQYQQARSQYESGKFLPMFLRARSELSIKNISFNAFLERLKKPFADAEGQISAPRRIEELCKLPVLTFDTAFSRVQLSPDRKFMLLGEEPLTANQMSDGINVRFEKIFKQFLSKTMAYIKGFIEAGKVDELTAFLKKSGYYKHLGDSYLKEQGFRLDLIRHGIKDSSSSESILKRIMKFEYFYGDNGILGDRAETLKLNRLHLVPLAIKLITDGGLTAKYKDLLEDLKEVPAYEKKGSDK